MCLQVLKVSDMAYHLPPVMRAPTVALDLPRSKLMKTVETTTTALLYLLSVCRYVQYVQMHSSLWLFMW